MMTVSLVQGAGLAEVGEFYRKVGYGGGVSEAGVTLAAKVDDRLVGVVRLCGEAGVIVLRGMHVDRGVACCLPYDHLVDFYRRVIRPAGPGDAPDRRTAGPPDRDTGIAAAASAGRCWRCCRSPGCRCSG